jgi:membrane protein implicated in regulation of membrane protease activity
MGPLALGQLGLGWWAHRLIERRGTDAHWVVLQLALASSALQAVVVSATMQQVTGDGRMQRFPLLGGVNMVAMVLALYADDLSGPQLGLVLGGLLAIIVLGLAVMPRPIVPLDFVATLLWTAASIVALAPIDAMFEAEAAAVEAELGGERQTVIEQEFDEGRHFMFENVRVAQRVLHREMARQDLVPPDTLANEITRRVAEIDRRITELQWTPAT